MTEQARPRVDTGDKNLDAVLEEKFKKFEAAFEGLSVAQKVQFKCLATFRLLLDPKCRCAFSTKIDAAELAIKILKHELTASIAGLLLSDKEKVANPQLIVGGLAYLGVRSSDEANADIDKLSNILDLVMEGFDTPATTAEKEQQTQSGGDLNARPNSPGSTASV